MTESVRRPLIGIPGSSMEPRAAHAELVYLMNGNYTRALAAAGAAPVIIPLNLPEDTLRAIFARLDGLCLAGGVDVDPAHFGESRHPRLGEVDAARDTTELLVARWALDADLPLIGICRGIQLLNVVAGGNLYQDLPAQLPNIGRHSYTLAESPRQRAVHAVHVASGSRLADALGTCDLRTNSYHHQAVKEIAPGFVPVAWAEDGVVEGIESPEHGFALGVQWHPEGMYETDPLARRFFAAFVAACSDGRGR